MKEKIINESSFPTVIIELNNESVKIEPGSMLAHDDGVTLAAQLANKGGLLKSVLNAAKTGESMFLTNAEGTGQLLLAPNLPGTVLKLPVGNEQFYFNTDALLAMDSTVSFTAERQSIKKAFLAGQGGLYVGLTQGQGEVLFNGYGNVIPYQINGSFTVDNAHVVAWSTSLDYDIRLATKGVFGSIGTGEGVVNHFTGQGTVYIQSLNIETLANQIKRFIPTKSN